jgi:8-oxo-dGTP pyrophosphatase MutT (NUDIX family)
MRTNKKVQAVIYRKKDSKYEFLILKYCKAKGGFYQNMTGGIETTDTSTFNALIRELGEELCLDKKDIITLLPEIYEFDFGKDSKKLHETVFGVEVQTNFQPKISAEHELFKWMNLTDALKNLKFDSNKEALKKLTELISK